jgi:hypothetical protein
LRPAHGRAYHVLAAASKPDEFLPSLSRLQTEFDSRQIQLALDRRVRSLDDHLHDWATVLVGPNRSRTVELHERLFKHSLRVS